MPQQVNKRKKPETLIVYNADEGKPVLHMPTVEEEIERLYGSLESIPSILKAILKEMVRARLQRG